MAETVTVTLTERQAQILVGATIALCEQAAGFSSIREALEGMDYQAAVLRVITQEAAETDGDIGPLFDVLRDIQRPWHDPDNCESCGFPHGPTMARKPENPDSRPVQTGPYL